MSRLYTKKKQEFDDTVYGYLAKRLSMPITDTDAYHTGHVDEKGNELKAPDDWSYTRLDKLVFDLKAILGDRVKNLGKAYADVDALLESLRRDNIQSLLVEGGAATLQTFIERDLWDEAWEEQSAVRLGDGVAAPQMPPAFKPEQEEHFGARFLHWKSPVCLLHYVDFK